MSISLHKSNDTQVILVAGVLFKRENQVLLVKEDDEDIWKSVGGTMEDQDKSLADTAIREVKEESGIQIKIDDDQKPLAVSFFKGDKLLQLFYFLVEWQTEWEKALKLGDNVVRMEWFDIGKLPDSASTSVKQAVKDFMLNAT